MLKNLISMLKNKNKFETLRLGKNLFARVQPADLPQQSSSGDACGPFVCADAYLCYILGRAPTRDDLCAQNEVALSTIFHSGCIAGVKSSAAEGLILRNCRALMLAGIKSVNSTAFTNLFKQFKLNF